MNTYLKIWHKAQDGTLSQVGRSLFAEGIPVCTGSTRKYELGQDDYIEVKFSSISAVSFKIGDLCFCEDSCFVIAASPLPTYNDNTAGLDYTLRMEADYMLWANRLHCLTYNGIRAESEWKLTGSISDHLQTIVDDLAVIGFRHITAIADDGTYTDEAWAFAIDSDLVDTGAKLIEYSNKSILEAIKSIAEAFECEWWVEGSVIHFGTRIIGTSWNSALRLTYGVEIEKLSVNHSEGNYANRLWVVGGTQNIPENYRKKVILQPTSILYNGGQYLIYDEMRPIDLAYFYGAVDNNGNVVGSSGAKTSLPLDFRTSTDDAGSYSGETSWEDDGAGHGMPVIYYYADINFGNSVSLDSGKIALTLQDMLLTVEGSNAPKTANINVIAYWDDDETPLYVESGNNINIGATSTLSELTIKPQYLDKTTNQNKDKARGNTLHICIRIGLLGSTSAAAYNVTLSVNAYSALTARGEYFVSKGLIISDANGNLIAEDVPFTCYRKSDKDNRIIVSRSYVAFDTKNPMLYYITIPDEILDAGKIPLYFYSGDPARKAVRGIAENRLLLPELSDSDKEIGYKAYRTADRHNTFYHYGAYIQTSRVLTENEIVEAVEVIEDEFPRETSGTGNDSQDYFTMEVTQRQEARTREFSDGTSITEHIPVYRFRNQDNTKEFYKSWVVEGATLAITFQSGLLAGMTFEVAFNPDGERETKKVYEKTVVNPASQVFEIVLNETYGRELPDAILFPQTGDKYLLTGWSPKTAGRMSIIAPAENRLLLKGIEKLQQKQLDGWSYEATMMTSYTAIGSPFVTADGDVYYVNDGTPGAVMIPFYVADADGEFGLPAVGRRVQLYHTALGINGQQTRVLGYEYPLDIPFDHPKLLLGMTPQKKRLKSLETAIAIQSSISSYTTNELSSQIKTLSRTIKQ